MSQPLVMRIRSDLEGKIRANSWPPGTRIPTERELMEQYGCARMTVNSAVTALVDAGLIERRKRAGSFVASPRVQTAIIEIPDIAAIIQSQGLSYQFVVLRRALKKSAEVQDAILQKDFRPRGRILVIDGLHIAGGENFCFEHRIVSLSTAPDMTDVDFETDAPGSWLLHHIPWSEARHRITACSAGKSAARLNVPTETACLKVERWTWLSRRPVTYASQLFPGDRFDLVAQFSP